MLGLQGGNGGVVTPPPHGDITSDSTSTDVGSRHQRRGTRDICSVFPTGAEAGGVSGRQVPGEGKLPREVQVKLHVLALEVEGGNSTGDTVTNAKMQSLWGAHASSATG